MLANQRQSIVFHPAVNYLLAMASGLAIYMLFAFVIPALHVDTGPGKVEFWFLIEYTLFFFLFFVSAGIVVVILTWRARLLYGRSTSRTSNDA